MASSLWLCSLLFMADLCISDILLGVFFVLNQMRTPMPMTTSMETTMMMTKSAL